MGEVVKIGDVLLFDRYPYSLSLYGKVYSRDERLGFFCIKWSDGEPDSHWVTLPYDWKIATKLDLYLRGLHDKV
jgi:hypothetical protein